MKTKVERMCPRCEGKGRTRKPYFSQPWEPCSECNGTGRVTVEVDAKRGYVCDACRHAFQADFTLEPETLDDLMRCCPSCGAAAFLRLETVGDVVRVLAVIGERSEG